MIIDLSKRIILSLVSLILAFGYFHLNAFAQKSVKPKIVSNVASEQKRNAALESDIITETEMTEESGKEVGYYYNFVDLNGDNVPEVLVYIFGGGYCGSGGCDLYIFKKVNEKYKLVSDIGLARNPIIVSQNKTKGWNDLIFFNVGGGIMRGYYSVCRFNGKSYCENPTAEDEAPVLRKPTSGTAYLVGKGNKNSGLNFQF